MSKTCTTTLLFTLLFLQLGTATISTDVRRDSSFKQHPPQDHVVGGSWARDFRHSVHKPNPEINGDPRFMTNPEITRKSLTETISGFGRVGESGGKPNLEQKEPLRFQTPPTKHRKAAEYDDKPIPEEKESPRFRVQPMTSPKGAESDNKPTPEEKTSPQFRIQPMKPPKATESDYKAILEEKTPPRFKTLPMKRRKATESDDKPTPEEKAPPRFKILPMNPPKAAESDDKPTPEEMAPPRFRTQPIKPPNGAESDDKPTAEGKAHPSFRIQQMKPPKAAESDDTPTSEKKAPPRFRIQPVKPRKIEHLAKKPIPSQPKWKTSSTHFHKVTSPTRPDRHLIRRAQPPNPQTPSPTTAAGKRWCVAKADTSDQVLHANIDYACRMGVDCKPIQKGGDCFNSSSLRSRASFVMNAFYNINSRKDFNCYFAHSGVLTSTNPSYGKCIYL